MAARAEVNGALPAVTTNSRMTSTASGMPGSAMTATSAARPRSEAIITARRGRRSASPDSTAPPMKTGITPITKVTAAKNADRVRS